MGKVKYLVGIDEVGRGPIAGPVSVCALAFEDSSVGRRLIRRFLRFGRTGMLRDSKLLTEKDRLDCFEEIARAKVQNAKKIVYSVSHVGQKIIDSKGIVSAVNLAISRSLNKINLRNDNARILLDGGLHAPKKYIRQRTVIRGDQKIGIIALASVIAKVARDKKMSHFSREYIGYGFEKHKGYGTAYHYEAIRTLGTCPLHRLSFLGTFRRK